MIDEPVHIPNTQPDPQSVAARVRLRSLYTTASMVGCEVIIFADREPHALPCLTDVAHESGWTLDMREDEHPDTGRVVTYQAKAGKGLITLYSVIRRPK